MFINNTMGRYSNDIKRLKKLIIPVLNRFDVKKAAFFGSLVKGDWSEGSDIDILVELSDDRSLFDFIELKNEIEDTTGRRVDLVEYETIKDALQERIMQEQVQIL